jgi:cytochrome c peroxidase
MRLKHPISLTGILIVAIVAASQISFSIQQNIVHPLKQKIPKEFPQPVYTFKNNPLTSEGQALGRKLFYDGRLSKDGYTACASCHQQFAAFADFEHKLSHGVNSRFTVRNAPPLFNLAWYKTFHLDGAINHIEIQPLAPMTGKNEMGNSIDSIISVLKTDKEYRKLFKAAFGTTEVNSQRILRALAQFTGNIVSANAKYDKMKRGEIVFNEWEKNGYAIFQTRCATCHPEPLFTDLEYHNIGLPVDSFLNDYGRMMITGERSDSLQFKTPSLRNVSRTDPYMHDGRIWGLSTAINHFQTWSATDSTTDTVIMHGKPLEKMEIKYLVSFLHTLLDSSLLTDPALSDPIPGNLIHSPTQ